MKQMANTKKLLCLGILGAAMGLVGDFLLGWLVYPQSDMLYAGMIAGCADLSYMRMGLSICFGGIGIPLQCFGFKAVAGLIYEGGHKTAARLVKLCGMATAAMGGAVHILCVVAMYLVRVECDHGFDPLAGETLLDTIPDSAKQFAVWGLLPFTVIFYVPFMAGLIAMFAAIVRKHTVLPRVACLFNPLLGMGLINTVTKLLPNTPLVNSIAMGNMGFGSLICFLGILTMLGFCREK